MPVCSACAEEFALKAGGICDECDEWSWIAMILVFCGMLVLLLIASQVKKWYNYFGLVQDLMDAAEELQIKAIFKILISALQVIGSLSTVLKISFPPLYVGFLRAFVSVFKFDISFAIAIGCVIDGAYLPSLSLNVGMAIVVVIAVLAVAFFQYKQAQTSASKVTEEDSRAATRLIFDKFDKDGDGVELHEVELIVEKVNPSVSAKAVADLFQRADKDGSGVIDFEEFFDAIHGDAHADVDSAQEFDLRVLVSKQQQLAAKSDATGRLFLLSFLLYPGLTNKIFDGFACRAIGPAAGVLIVDYTVLCWSDGGITAEWVFLLLLCSALALLWSIGLPAMLWFRMFRVRKLIEEDDEDTLALFDFVLGDYKKEYWYWEVVELTRKLLLTGIIGLVGAGTIAQSAVATLVTFGFFAASYREQPFNTTRLNSIKVFSEFQVFGILLVSLLLQANKAMDLESETSEFIDYDGYGLILTGLTLGILPITAYFFAEGVRDMMDEAKELTLRTAGKLEDAEEDANPIFETESFEIEPGKRLASD